MLKPVYLVAFSGHRPNGTTGRTDQDLENTAPHLRAALQELIQRAEAVGGEVHLLVSIAAGADIVACETALDLGLPLHLFMPLPDEKFWGTFENLTQWLPRAKAILATVMADRRHTYRLASRSQVSPYCYEEMNARMLEAANLLLTVSTGQPSRTSAGTQHLSDEADELEIPIINIDPTAPAFSPASHAATLGSFAKADCPSLAIFTELSHHVTCPLTDSKKPRHAQIASCLSSAAGKSSKAFRHAIATAISLHAIAGFLAAWAASYFHALYKHPHAYLILALFAFTEFLLVGGAFGLELWAKKAKKQHAWLHCRFAREQMRSHLAANAFLDPLFPTIGQHHSQWTRFAIASRLLIRAEEVAPSPIDPPPKDIYSSLEKFRKSRIEDQIHHFREKAHAAHRTYHLWHGLSHWAAPAALVVVIVALYVKADAAFFHYHHTPVLLQSSESPWFSAFPLLFLPIFLPLIASLSSSFLAAFDFGRRAVRYQEMVEALENILRKLPPTPVEEKPPPHPRCPVPDPNHRPPHRTTPPPRTRRMVRRPEIRLWTLKSYLVPPPPLPYPHVQ
jgi:hypothetical protein